MPLTLPKAPAKYDQKNEQDTRAQLEKADRENLKTGADADLGSGSVGFIIRSPDGTRWRASALNNGALVLTSL